jgi:hypothetical protein
MARIQENQLEFFIDEIDPSTFHLGFELQGERLLEYQRTFTTEVEAKAEAKRILSDILRALGKHAL